MNELEAFDSGENRDGRRDERVAIKQRGADNAEDEDDVRALAHRAAQEP